MTTSREIVLIGGVVKSLHKYDSWCGETHIQKASYVAKYVEQVPFESEFILYKHGPFSFDLNAAIGQMRAQSLLRVIPQTIGSTYTLREGLWSAVNLASGDLYGKFQDKIDHVCEILGRLKVAELERIVTAIFVRINYPDLDIDKSISKLISLKPHIQMQEALLAFERAKVFTSKLPIANGGVGHVF